MSLVNRFNSVQSGSIRRAHTLNQVIVVWVVCVRGMVSGPSCASHALFGFTFRQYQYALSQLSMWEVGPAYDLVLITRPTY